MKKISHINDSTYKEDLKDWYSKSLFKIPYQDDREWSFDDLDLSMTFGVEQSFLEARNIVAEVINIGGISSSIGESYGVFINKDYICEYPTRKQAMIGTLIRAIAIYEDDSARRK
jgi:hypothetical protein